MSIHLRTVPPFVVVALLCLLAGFAITVNVQVAFVFVLLAVGVAALGAPAAAWVVAAVVATLMFRGLVQLGLLPSVTTFADIGFAWGALAVAYLRRDRISREAAPLLRRLGMLAAAALVAWGFHRSEVARPFLYLALLGQPFAIVGALLLDPPTPRLRRILTHVLAALIALQVPIALAQSAGHLVAGRGDPVQGTLYGAGSGTDTMSAVVAVGALWLLAGTRVRLWWRVSLAGLALAIPLIADAKQVILALPAGLLAISPRRRRTVVLQAVAVLVSVGALFAFAPAGASGYLEQNAHGRGGKEAAARFLWRKLDVDPASVLFGLGPAETVSRAAFMTTPMFLGANSPLRIFRLRPARVAVEAQTTALVSSGGGSSFNSGVSSALGVLGDLGVLGFLVYLTLPLWIIRRVRRSGAAVNFAAAAGWGMLLVLGVVYDWWEQPPFGIAVAALAGLAMTARVTNRAPALESPEVAR